jgi:hypothetical protein
MRARTATGVLVTAALLAFTAGCARDLDVLDPAPFPSEAVVFDDGFASGVNFQAFLGSKTDAVQIDQVDTYQGSASLRITVPTPTDPSGSYAGGAFTANTARDLSGYNALTFYAKAATAATLNVVGIGNDNTGTSLYQAETGGFALTSSWRKYVVPFPLPEKLDQEGGLFFFAEGAENGQANVIWFDEIQFEDLPDLGAPQPAVVTKTVSMAVGETTQADGTVTFQVDGQNVVMSAFPSYFTWTSSNPSVATVSERGLITMVAEGTAEITASLGSLAAAGSVTVQTGAGLAGLVFGDDFGEGVDYQAFAGSKTDAVQLDDTEAYQGSRSLKITIPAPGDPSGDYAGGAFTTTQLRDLTSYNALTFWAKAATPAALNVAGIGNDNTGTSLYTAETSGLALTSDWQKFILPIPLPEKLDQEGGLFFFAEGAEDGQANTFWFDEIQFENLDMLGPGAPAVVTKTETLGVGETTQADGTVTFNVFGDVVMSAAPSYFTWTSSNPAVATVSATGLITMVAEGTAEITATLGTSAASGSVTVQTTPTATKKYSGLDFNGIETTTTTIDATAMTHVRMDIWTPDATQFGIKLVDFGADGAFGGGDDVEHQVDINAGRGDDVEHQVDINAGTTPALATGEWVSLDIPLSAFTGLTTRDHLAQYIIVGQPTGATTVWVDNFYFHN